jgi:hypothetical protein
MATYDYIPTQFDGVSLTASPFDFVIFDAANGPGQAERVSSVMASISGLGSRFVRGQPQPSTWVLTAGLVDGLEATKRAMDKIFSPKRGLVYIGVNDGDGVAWKAACVVESVTRVEAMLFSIVLAVPDAVLISAATSTVQDLNKAGPVFTRAINPGGNRATPLSILMTADAQKVIDPAYDFAYMRRGFILNRAPYWWENLPIDCSDYNGGVAPINTSAEINDTTIHHLANGAATDVATTIVVDTLVGTFAPAGFAFVPSTGEQFYYASKTATQFQGCVRGIGGTAKAAIADNAQINASRMLHDLSDFRMFVNQVEVPVSFGNGDPGGNASTKPFIELEIPARVKLSALKAGTAGYPAEGGGATSRLAFAEGVTALPPSGILNWGRELIYYSAKDDARGEVIVSKRAIWHPEGTAGAHATSDPVYLCRHLTTMAWGRRCARDDGDAGSWPAGSTAIADPDALGGGYFGRASPVIDRHLSTNLAWYWRFETFYDFAFYDYGRPQRPANLLPDYQIDPADLNRAPALRNQDTISSLLFRDAAAAAGKTQAPKFTIFLPQGVKASAGAITATNNQHRRHIRLQIYGRDAGGVEEELYDAADIAETLGGIAVTPGAVLHYLTLAASRAYTTGSVKQTGDMQVTGETILQKLVLDQDTEVDSIQILMKNSLGGGTATFQCEIKDDTGANPEAGRTLVVFAAGPALTTGYLWYEARVASQSIRLPAGIYWVRAIATGGTGTVFWGKARASTKNDLLYKFVAAAYQGGDACAFFIVHKHRGPVQAESELLNEGRDAGFAIGPGQHVLITLNNSATDPYTPKVDRTGNAEVQAYHYQPTVKNLTNGDQMDFSIFGGLNGVASVFVDPEVRQVAYLEGSFPSLWVWYLSGAMTPVDLENWMNLEPDQSNTIEVTEYMAASVDYTFNHDPRRV